MEIKITFPGGKKVNAEINNQIICTDQPVESGGEGSAPTPFDYFLASLGTCAGIYVLSFCQQRQIATEGLALSQRMEFTTAADGKRKLAKSHSKLACLRDFQKNTTTPSSKPLNSVR